MQALASPTNVRTSTTCGALLRELEVSSLFFSFNLGFLLFPKGWFFGREKLSVFSICFSVMGFFSETLCS